MGMMHDPDTAPNISRGAYGDSISSLSLLAGVMTALFARERTRIGQQVEVSLYNTATWVLGFDITGCLVTGKNAPRPQRKSMANPIRNHYPTKDNRWIMLGMTNAQTYWPEFCRAIDRPELQNDPKFVDFDARQKTASNSSRSSRISSGAKPTPSGWRICESSSWCGRRSSRRWR